MLVAWSFASRNGAGWRNLCGFTLAFLSSYFRAESRPAPSAGNSWRKVTTKRKEIRFMNKIERNVKGGISLETRIIITQIFQRENILYFYPHRVHLVPFSFN